MAEFDIISKYFTRPAQADVGIGDDAALIRVRDGYQLAVSADMSVAGTHFFSDINPFAIGWKSMAVNISDMAAMGAEPKWATLSIALPELDESWLRDFSDGLFKCAEAFGVSLIGGDTTRGPLNIAINIMGEVPFGQALQRNGAQVGDDIWVSGELGCAALWLQYRLGQLVLHAEDVAMLATAMHHPQPRVALGQALRGIATAALDISDGLLADLGHILKASKVGAMLDWQAISQPVLQYSQVSEPVMQQAVLTGGDDYELCFTAPATERQTVLALSGQLGLPLSRIGKVQAEPGLQVFDARSPIVLSQKGYDHFG
ncbi:thiamine-phosphate kinase [Methylophilus sp.]|uniref:thiamine-phosphate kinase n=1 Tax=Methylophilus sp. TaxID=29541 RepID=UPI000D412E40|nr:thiamine-phosphate kinase [Methylophilus sp.]PPD13066.1 MAG: thiamine-phosphate kinase [Methylophilus sp.]